MDPMKHLRLALRRLGHRPGFTAVAVLSLALGIGANTTMFSLLDAVVLRAQPYAEPEQLLEIYEQLPDFAYSPLSYPDFEDLRRATTDLFAGVAGAGFDFMQLDVEGGVEGLFGQLVSSNYFAVLGIEPLLGRTFEPSDDAGEGDAPVAILSYDGWQRSFGGDSGIVGREIRLNGRAFTVIGVMPEEFQGDLRGFVPAVFVPVSMDVVFSPGRRESRNGHWFFVKGRLREGVEPAAVNTALATLTQDLEQRFPDEWDEKQGFATVPTSRVVVNPMIDGFLWTGGAVLMVLVAVVLTIACANLASFLLARAADQRRDVAIRLALGATRRRLVAQQMLDAVLLSLLGGAAGAALAATLVRLLREAELPGSLPLRLEAVIDVRVLAFCFAASLVAAVLFGLAPALQATRIDAAPVLKDEGTGGGAGRQRLRAALVVGQVALSTLLLVSAGLFVRSLVAMQATDPGFGRAPTAVLNLGLPPLEYGGDDEEKVAARRAFFDRLRERAAAVPGVEAVGLIDNLHLNVTNTQGIQINVDGVEPPPGLDAHSVDYAIADAGFFATAGVEVISGRGFGPQDRPETRPVAIVSQAFAQRFFPDRSPLGQMIRRKDREPTEIVGVAADTMVRFLGEQPRPFVYLDADQIDQSSTTLLARTAADARALAGTLLRTARELEPELIVFESKTVRDHLATQMLPSRALALVFLAFALLALVLALIGLYGVVSYQAASRAREIGIRMSLGASAGRVLGLMMRGGLSLVLAGGLVGMVLALVVSKLLGSLLFAIDSADAMVFLGVPALLLAAAGLAVYLPARRALRVDPAKALRSN